MTANVIELENSFVVPASADRTMQLLDDVPRVIPCLPGAELIAVVGPHTWKAKMRVSIGPIGLQFDTDVTRERGGGDRSVLLVVDARESRGKGGARATIRSTVEPTDGAASRVGLRTDVVFDGAVAEVAVGPLISDIARQLTRRFSECLAAQLVSGTRTPAPEPTPVSGLRLVVVAAARSFAHRLRRLTN